MKKILALIFFLLISAPIFAQVAAKNTITFDALQVTIVVKKEVVKTAPYARYAPQFLGELAPLNDKTTYSIEAVNISKIGTDTKLVHNHLGVKTTVAGELNISKATMLDRPLQDMARDAAQIIYNLRKRRMDMVTGESQDAYGAGVAAAIKEINRLEEEYIALFLGKKITSYSTHNFSLIPRKDKSNYVLCRFSAERGIVDILNDEGNQVALSLTAENVIVPMPNLNEAPKKGETPIIPELIPDWVSAVVICDTKVLNSTVVQLPQFGKVIAPSTDRR